MKLNKFNSIALALTLGMQYSVIAQNIKEVQKLIDNEQYENAITQLDALINKGEADAYYYKGYVLQELDDPQNAFKLYSEGISKNATNALNYVGLGRKHLAFGDITTAKENFDKALTLAPKDVNVYNGVAEAYIKGPQHDFSNALKVIEKAEKLDPKNETTKLLFGDIIYERDKKTGNLSTAISKYNEVEAINPNNSRALMRKGKIYEKGRNYNAAIENYEEAVKKNPNFAPAYREQGEIYAKAQLYAKAKESYEKYLNLSGASKSAQMRYLNFLWETKDYDKVIVEGTKLTSLKDYNNSVDRVMAYSYYEKGDFTNAEIKMNQFFGKQPAEKVTFLDHIYLGRILNKINKKTEAVQAFEKAVLTDSVKGAEAYGDLGLLYFEQKKYNEATINYGKKDKVGIATANEYFRYGLSFYLMEKYPEALTIFDKLILKAPTFPNGYYWKSKSISMQGKGFEEKTKDAFEAYLNVLTPDKIEANKDDVVEAYKYIVKYVNNTLKDTVKTKEYLEKLKLVDGSNAFIKEAETKIAKKQML